ncbi:MAG: hypothetical protein JWM85_1627 [Acidimicrobiaceae bacterium]|nr:hypothetical protein [Acidimicrobiaceae bacterium]
MAEPVDPPSRGVMTVVLTPGGQLFLHHRDDLPGVLYPGHWAGFGGSLEAGETPEDALIREMEEETGLVIAPGEATVVGEIIDPEADGRIVTLSYVVRELDLEEIVLTEGQGFGLFSPEELDGLLLVPFVRELIERHLLGLLDRR